MRKLKSNLSTYNCSKTDNKYYMNFEIFRIAWNAVSNYFILLFFAAGHTISPKTRQVSVERVKYLESKIQEIEEASSCSICMERRKNVAFLCGHGACVVCSQTLKTCHMCRKPITKKINLY